MLADFQPKPEESRKKCCDETPNGQAEQLLFNFVANRRFQRDEPEPSITRSKVKIPASRIDAPICTARAMMSCAVSIASAPYQCLTNNPECEVSVCHMCVDGNDAPDDFVGSRAQQRQRNVQQRVVGAIQMQIAFVHFFPRRVEDLNAANGGFDILCKSNSDLAW